jgi:hypothetical protein
MSEFFRIFFMLTSFFSQKIIVPLCMSIIVIHSQKKWNISKKELSIFERKEIEGTLKQFNQSCSGVYYMMDYFNQQIITDSPSSPILCGHPKEIADKEGFGFLERILVPEEQIWSSQVNEAGFDFFFNHDEKKRMDLRLSYDLKVRQLRVRNVRCITNLHPSDCAKMVSFGWRCATS